MSKTPSAPGPINQVAKRPSDQSRLAAILGYMLHGKRRPNQITIISHSNLFYWWPMWFIGFIMAGITYYHGVHAGFIVGNPTVATVNGKIVRFEDDIPEQDKKHFAVDEAKDFQAIVSDRGEKAFPTTTHGEQDKHFWPYIHNSRHLGDIFMVVLLLVIVITNSHMRGLWSLVVVIVLVLGTIILSLSGILETLITQSRLLAIHINLGAYLFFSLVLFVVWVVSFAVFDRQRYVIVDAAQVRLRTAVGEGETAYDTMGMVFQKQRSDLFRHWILGFGSGDLVIRPAGGKDPIDLPNVLFVGGKVREITNLMREKPVVVS